VRPPSRKAVSYGVGSVVKIRKSVKGNNCDTKGTNNRYAVFTWAARSAHASPRLSRRCHCAPLLGGHLTNCIVARSTGLRKVAPFPCGPLLATAEGAGAVPAVEGLGMGAFLGWRVWRVPKLASQTRQPPTASNCPANTGKFHYSRARLAGLAGLAG
jgi:hypothetical protein